MLAVITILILVLIHQQGVTTTYVTITPVTQEQTPFQWFCPEQPKVNCSTVNPVSTIAEKVVIKNITYPEDGDTPEPVPTGNPVPTIIPSPTGTVMPVPEFPFLPIR